MRRTGFRPAPWRAFAALWLALLALPASAQERRDAATPPWLAAADSLARLGQNDEALLRYRQLSVTHGEASGLWLRIALLELQREQPEAALAAAHRAKALAPEDPETALVLAQVQLPSVGAEAAMATLEEALAKHPEDVALLEMVANFAVGMGQPHKAVGSLVELVRLQPKAHGFRFDLARLLLNSNDPAQASKVLNDALAAGADPAIAQALLGKCALVAGDRGAARASFERSLAVRPDAEAYSGLGALAFVEERPAEAVTHFRAALELARDDPDLWFNLGNALVQLGRVDEAEEAFRESLRLDPFAAPTHLNLGIVQMARFRPEAARRNLQRSIELDPLPAAPYLHLARLHAALFEHAGARRNYESYLERVDDADERARIQEVLQQLASAEAATKAARQRGEIHLLQLRVGTREEAAALLDRARAGEDFYALAERFSQLREAAGVDAGFLAPAELAPTFRDALLELRPREFSPPLQGPNGWYVFQRVE